MTADDIMKLDPDLAIIPVGSLEQHGPHLPIMTDWAIAEAFGGSLINLPEVFHGVATKMNVIDDDILFYNMLSTLTVGRYHSWVVNTETFPDCLKITAIDENGMIMALKHRKYNVHGVQFHPESVLTPQGEEMLKNWLTAP